MTVSAATAAPAHARIEAWINGALGMLIFSGSLPATRAAVADLDPVFLTFARAAIAGVLAAIILVALRPPRPERRDLPAYGLVAFGVVLGFPLLTALALRHVTAAHAVVFVGLLPLATAGFAVLRGGERPRAPFWLFSGFGALAVAGFALREGATVSLAGDGLLLASIVVCGLGYAEGARLARRTGGWQVICWALVLSIPLMLPAALWTTPVDWAGIGAPALWGFAYVSLFSMLIGFFFWYRGLALGGIAAIGQLQLLQPFCGLALAALTLGEEVGWATGIVALVVMGCVAGARRFVP